VDDDGDLTTQPDERGARGGLQDAADSYLTPEACAISAFTFAVLTLDGQGIFALTAQALFRGSFAESRVGLVLASTYVATLLLVAGAVWLARRTLRHPVAAGTWAGHLARAAVVLAGVGGLIAAVGLVASLARPGL
jgi:hypothetical protein